MPSFTCNILKKALHYILVFLSCRRILSISFHSTCEMDLVQSFLLTPMPLQQLLPDSLATQQIDGYTPTTLSSLFKRYVCRKTSVSYQHLRCSCTNSLFLRLSYVVLIVFNTEYRLNKNCQVPCCLSKQAKWTNSK